MSQKISEQAASLFKLYTKVVFSGTLRLTPTMAMAPTMPISKMKLFLPMRLNKMASLELRCHLGYIWNKARPVNPSAKVKDCLSKKYMVAEPRETTKIAGMAHTCPHCSAQRKLLAYLRQSEGT